MRLLIAALLPVVAGCSDVCRSDAAIPDGICLATYQEALDAHTEGACAGACADWDVVWYQGGGAGWRWCAYDPGTGRLTGAITCSDVNEYCNGDSFCVTYGEAPDKHPGEPACGFSRIDQCP